MPYFATYRCPRCNKLILLCYSGRIIYYRDKYEFVCSCGNLVRFRDETNEFIEVEKCPEGSEKVIRIDKLL